ncbi:MAG: GtrA family protein [Bacteroidota bacterium]
MESTAERLKQLLKTGFDLKIIRFFFVAGLNTIFGYGIFAFFLFIGLHYTIAGFIATVLGILFNFKMYGLLVFKNKSNKLIIRFLMVYFVTYCIAIFFIWALEHININHYYALVIIAFPNALLAYFLNKKLVFEKNNG